MIFELVFYVLFKITEISSTFDVEFLGPDCYTVYLIQILKSKVRNNEGKFLAPKK